MSTAHRVPKGSYSFQSLLPIKDIYSKVRTGYLFDTDDGNNARVQLSAKIVTDDDGDSFIHVRLWTRDAGVYTHYAIGMASHGILAVTSGAKEKKAWRRLVWALRPKGWKIYTNPQLIVEHDGSGE